MNRFAPHFIASGRVLLALMFAISGIGKLASISGTVGYMASVGLPNWSVLAISAGLFELIAALALAAGWNARWAALALALFTLAASVMFHNFWALEPSQQVIQQLMFMKNLSVAGGMLIVAAYGAGPFSVDGMALRKQKKVS